MFIASPTPTHALRTPKMIISPRQRRETLYLAYLLRFVAFPTMKAKKRQIEYPMIQVAMTMGGTKTGAT
jgi:hypothetical protein